MTNDRQNLFSGTEAPPAHLALELNRIGPFISERIDGFGRIHKVEKFKGGQSNPTYKIAADGGLYVLRRRPPGPLLASAHAIDREFIVMEAVAKAGIPVPRTYFYCEDEAVIGSPFYIVGYNAGRVFWNAEMPDASPEDRALAYDDMNARLAQLHQIDYNAVGLGQLSSQTGFIARNLARWSRNYEQSELVDIPDMNWLIRTLPEMLPATSRTCLIHGDYGLYNVILGEEVPRIQAIIDWEMATLGDPFVDLAHHVRAWWEVPDTEGVAATSLVGRDLAHIGIPDMDSYIDLYCRRVGIAELPYRRFYLGYAQFRNAVMVQGILKRMALGTASSHTTVHRQDRVLKIAALARGTLEGKDR